MLHYGTNAGKEGDQAQIIVEVSFSNYENAVLILNLKCMDERIIYTVTFDMSGHGAAIPPAVVSGKGEGSKSRSGLRRRDTVFWDGIKTAFVLKNGILMRTP